MAWCVFSNYKITNTINGMLYIGSTRWKPEARWTQHRSYASMGISHPLYDAMREYGVEHFTFEVIKEHRGKNGEKSMLASENTFILSLNTLVPNGYNCQRAIRQVTKLPVYPGWYRAKDAIKVLIANSQREIKNIHLAKFAEKHGVRTKRISPHVILYRKNDIDSLTANTKPGRPRKQNNIPIVKRKRGRPRKLSPYNITQPSLWQQDAETISVAPRGKRE